MTILIIEDEKELRELFRDLFLEKGLKVLVAENGLIGLEILASNSIDLVLTDIQMPIMSGIDFLLSAKSLNKSLPPIVVMSGGSPYSVGQIYQAGAVAFFDKINLSPHLVLNYLAKSA